MSLPALISPPITSSMLQSVSPVTLPVPLVLPNSSTIVYLVLLDLRSSQPVLSKTPNTVPPLVPLENTTMDRAVFVGFTHS